ncbi:serpin family protein [Candidatus Uabimicrobium sp. HlEnr_7]|uniref:serpin family protein n=1 Tax=Candidatus Uabimicrobium helgolandensis TaxID=3095367 RepID=UPI0035588FA1
MRKTFLIFILGTILLTQCENTGNILEPILRERNPSNPGEISTPGDTSPNIGLPSKTVEKDDELIHHERYPRFVINSFNGAGKYTEITEELRKPTAEDIHANTAISVFRMVSNRYNNAVMSPFLFCCDNNGSTELSRITQLTNNKLNISNGSHLRLGVDKAVYFSAGWDQKQSTQSTNIMFRNSEVAAIKILGSCYYYKNSDMQLIYLPLKHAEFSVYLFVPNSPNGLPQLLSNMQFPQMNEAVQKLKKRKCDIDIPAFRLYFNFGNNTNQRVTSILQLDQQGCEFSSVHTRWSAIQGMNTLTTNQRNAKYEDEELDLAKIKSPYLKNKSQESIKATIDQPFFLVLRHLKTGEFLCTAAINDLEQVASWQSVVQHLTPDEMNEGKSGQLERFGWGYTKRRFDPKDMVPEDNNNNFGNQ